MKFVIALLFLSAGVNAFSVTNNAKITGSVSPLRSEAVVEEVTKTTVPLPTRFDKLRKKYKGYTLENNATNVDFSYDDLKDAFVDKSYSFNRFDVVKGTVFQYEKRGCFVDIGAKSAAYLPLQEAALIQKPGDGIQQLVDTETETELQIISEEDENGQLLVSIKRIQHKKAWEDVIERHADDQAFEAEVIAVNRGGAICLVDGLRAFLPGSHLAGQLPTEDLIGTTLPLKFLQVDREEDKLVVSNRRAVVERQMTQLSRGDIITGEISALKPYGAFVQVGDMSGLLHISQISYDRIENLEALLQPGQAVKCMIIDHDKVNGRIALSTKTLEPQPGDMLRDAEKVFRLAEETAQKYHERMEAERKAREDAAKDIVLGLGDSLDKLSLDGSSDEDDPLAGVSDSLDSLLA